MISRTLYRRAALLRAAIAALAILLLASAVPTRAAAAPASPTPTAPAATGSSDSVRKATFGVQPATDGKPDGRPNLTYGATAGATFTDHVAVINASEQKYTLEVYATDAVNNDAGDLTLLAAGTKPTDAGSWIQIGGSAAGHGTVSVKPRSYVVVPLTVHIPEDASPGDHVAGVVADLVTVSRRNQVNVKLHQRVGLRTFIRVAGDVQPALAIENLSVHYANNWNPIGSGSAVVTYRVHNVGNVSLGAHQGVEIDGLLGKTASATPPTIPLLLPGGAIDVRVPMSGVTPEIWMTAKVHLTPLVPSGNVDAGVIATSASATFWAVPWVLIGIVILLIVGAVFFWRWRRKIKKSPGRHSTPKSSKKNGERSDASDVKEKVVA